jgi:hypothetical protein
MDKITRLALWGIGSIVICFMIVTLASMVNCIYQGQTCPPQGSLREVLEDVLALLVGFVGGRMSARRSRHDSLGEKE